MAQRNLENNGGYAAAEDVRYVGVDGCPGGWFSVGFTDAGQYEFHVSPNFETLVHHYPAAKLILVDIPIGIPTPGIVRQCDLDARRHLGNPRSRSVFPVPLRQVMCYVCDGGTYDEANMLTRQLDGRGLPRQSFTLLPKIIAADTFLTNRAQNINPKIREVHPEVCFWALNNRVAMAHSKRELAGIMQRVQVMARPEIEIDARNVLHMAYQHIPVGVGCDDFCDALVAAITAFLGHNHLQVLGQINQVDAVGLPMEMVYWQAP